MSLINAVLRIVAVSDRVCQGKNEVKKVIRKEERRKIKIGMEERKNRNSDRGEGVYFMVVKENVIQSIHYVLLEHSIVCRSLVDRCVKITRP